jgi:antitoxin component of MazEF toxin-antitoxin module
MRKIISKIGNSSGIMLDAALMELAHLKRGDKANLEVHDGGIISLTPIHPRRTGKQIKKRSNRS